MCMQDTVLDRYKRSDFRSVTVLLASTTQLMPADTNRVSFVIGTVPTNAIAIGNSSTMTFSTGFQIGTNALPAIFRVCDFGSFVRGEIFCRSTVADVTVGIIETRLLVDPEHIRHLWNQLMGKG